MRILVTGCAGFIGFHLSTRLLQEGHEVIGVDNLSTGQQRSVTDLQAQVGFQFLEHDITNPILVEGPLDQIYNLACPASPADFDLRRLEILATCSQGVRNVLELARRCEATLIHASTSEVYGDPEVHPQTEDYRGSVNPIGPRSCYDEGKRFAEALISACRIQYGLETRLARIFNTYGPRMRSDDGRCLPNFINQALRGEPLTVHGDGRQTRSFCYVSDLVEGLLRLGASEVVEPVNLGNPVEITIIDLAHEVIRLTESRSSFLHTSALPDDPKVRCPDITRARQRLGWEPVVERSAGLRQTIDWFKSAR
jgi:nucleoside-diphosphate-sugar epimerase